jgi:hypothetical protein
MNHKVELRDRISDFRTRIKYELSAAPLQGT